MSSSDDDDLPAFQPSYTKPSSSSLIDDLIAAKKKSPFLSREQFKELISKADESEDLTDPGELSDIEPEEEFQHDIFLPLIAFNLLKLPKKLPLIGIPPTNQSLPHSAEPGKTPPLRSAEQIERITTWVQRAGENRVFRDEMLKSGWLMGLVKDVDSRALQAIPIEVFNYLFALVVFSRDLNPLVRDAAHKVLLHVISSQVPEKENPAATPGLLVTATMLLAVLNKYGIQRQFAEVLKLRESGVKGDIEALKSTDLLKDHHQSVQLVEFTNVPSDADFPRQSIIFLLSLFNASLAVKPSEVFRISGSPGDLSVLRVTLLVVSFLKMDAKFTGTVWGADIDRTTTALLSQFPEKDLVTEFPLIAGDIFALIPANDPWARLQFIQSFPGGGRGSFLLQHLAFLLLSSLASKFRSLPGPTTPKSSMKSIAFRSLTSKDLSNPVSMSTTCPSGLRQVVEVLDAVTCPFSADTSYVDLFIMSKTMWFSLAPLSVVKKDPLVRPVSNRLSELYSNIFEAGGKYLDRAKAKQEIHFLHMTFQGLIDVRDEVARQQKLMEKDLYGSVDVENMSEDEPEPQEPQEPQEPKKGEKEDVEMKAV